MPKQCICLRAVDPQFEGKIWQSDHLLRIGRAVSMEIVLNDGSISRRHAEIALTNKGWVVRDLGSTNGTFVNGIRVGWAERKLYERDVVQCGNIVMIVVFLRENVEAGIETPVGNLQVQATTKHSWEEALELLAVDIAGRARPAEQLVNLLRAGHFLYQGTSFEGLLSLSLQQATTALKAQRGCVLLLEASTGELSLRAVFPEREAVPGTTCFSNTLVQRCFRSGESILSIDTRTDADLLRSQSVLGGAMSSIICALLRTPHTRLGVLHLDRGPTQDPFEEDDLNLADAVAASLSAGFASAQVLQDKQRSVFIQTVIALAQALQLRDPLTSGHAQRVADYSLIVAHELGLSEEDRQVLQIGAPLHDIGKIGVEDAVLLKKGIFTPDDRERMKEHCVKGASLIETIPDLAMILPIIRSHHERWDGLGYPDALAGDRIPHLARILAVADAFDSLTFEQPYHAARSTTEALECIAQGAGTQFDAECVRVFLSAHARIEHVHHHHQRLHELASSPGPELIKPSA